MSVYVKTDPSDLRNEFAKAALIGLLMLNRAGVSREMTAMESFVIADLMYEEATKPR